MSRDKYFMEVAKLTAKRGSCPKLHVGCVIVKNKRIVSLGFNGAPAGMEECEKVGCALHNNHCLRAIHAEANAIISSAKTGVNIDHGEIYTTVFPCNHCLKMLINAGIKRIIYLDDYDDECNKQILREAMYAGIIKIMRWKNEDI